jgi:serine/threonine protein kinase
MSSNIEKVKAIFHAALDEYRPDEWESYVCRACGDDLEMRREALALLRAHQGGGSVLVAPVIAPSGFEAAMAEQVGSKIGPYQLLELIGEGGMGVVFLAEQQRPVRRQVALKVIKPGMDTRQVIARFEAERQALAMMDHPNIAKVLDAGTTSVARSLRERESGSRSEPPTLDPGRPYFVMELVQGVPITEYCDQCNLTTRERLELFISVCQAVQHAHQKGIIHRDIKPTNVLVAMQDGKATPKIIDFGVAKAIGEQPLTDRTLTTAFAQMVGTPMYMSPEQAELSPLGVDTRSDIYSLGVLLYELLTGTTPFDKDRLHSASYDEMRRIIREEEPPKPSTRLSSLSLGSKTRRGEERAGMRVKNSLPLGGRGPNEHGQLNVAQVQCGSHSRSEREGVSASRSGEPSRTTSGSLPLAGRPENSSDSLPLGGRAGEGVSAGATKNANVATTIAERRRTDPRRLIQTVRGELDWIVMKCLEKDRNRRYETPNSLARDIERYLNDEPVQACPLSASYRFRKFARRNKTLLAAGGAIAAALVIGLGLSTWMYFRAAAERDRAKTISDFLQWSLPSRIAEVEAILRSGIVDDEHDQKFDGQPAAEAELAGNYAWLADYLATTDRQEEANAVVRKAADHLAHAAKSSLSPSDDLYHCWLAIAQLRLRDEAGYRETCVAMRDFQSDDDQAKSNWLVMWCLGPHPGEDLSVQIKQAEELLAKHSANGYSGGSFVRWGDLATVGGLLYRAGQYEQAAQRLEESLAAYPEDALRDFRTALDKKLLLAMAKWQLGRRDEARRLLAETLPALDKWLQKPINTWMRRAEIELIRREAEALIEPKEANESVDDKSQINDEPKQ